MIPINPNKKAHRDQIVWGGRILSPLCTKVRWKHFYSIIQTSFSQGRLVKPTEFGLSLLILKRDAKNIVDLSNILDGEVTRRKPAEGPHGEVVGALVVNSELFCKVIQGVKAVAGVKMLLVLPVAARHLAVAARRVGPDALVADTQLGGGGLKQSG